MLYYLNREPAEGLTTWKIKDSARTDSPPPVIHISRQAK